MEQPTKKTLAEIVHLIKSPSVTEKSINLYAYRQYTFLVDRSLTKWEIKYALEKIFNVTITGISTCILPQKTRRVGKSLGNKPVYKKAFVRLKVGETISELFN